MSNFMAAFMGIAASDALGDLTPDEHNRIRSDLGGFPGLVRKVVEHADFLEAYWNASKELHEYISEEGMAAFFGRHYTMSLIMYGKADRDKVVTEIVDTFVRGKVKC